MIFFKDESLTEVKIYVYIFFHKLKNWKCVGH